jgi:hypothetical protein
MAPQVLQPQAVVVLYHQRTGAIAHTHYFAAAGDAALPQRDELERVAFAHAERDGHKVAMHKAMHVDPATLKPGTGYGVSVAKQALVQLKPARIRLRRPRPAASPSGKK